MKLSVKTGSHISPMIGESFVCSHSRRKFTKDFTHEQSPTIVVAAVGNI